VKKQLIIIGIIALLVGVWLSGCQETSHLTSISSIRSHTNSYINKTITIQGTCSGGNDNSPYMIFDTSYSSIYAINLDNVIKPSKLYSGTTYEFIGVIRDKGNQIMILDEFYLEMTKIETT